MVRRRGWPWSLPPWRTLLPPALPLGLSPLRLESDSRGYPGAPSGLGLHLYPLTPEAPVAGMNGTVGAQDPRQLGVSWGPGRDTRGNRAPVPRHGLAEIPGGRPRRAEQAQPQEGPG